jgi:tetratricopeptide (TPR) repeat protein
MGDEDTPPERRLPLRSLPLAQREVALLIALCVLCVGLFAGTRRLAGWSHGQRAEAAAKWFARGEALSRDGDTDAGIAALREAFAADRQNATYTLALARVLDDAGRDDEARQLLLELRQRQPDDVEVNYRLAGLAALYGDSAEAIRYYNYAMYGLKRIGRDYERWRIRLELVTLLIARGDLQEATTQLGSLSRELPDDVEAQMQAARLADRADDQSGALQFYTRASALDPKNAQAALGVGTAAFAQRDFRTASRELARAVDLGAASADVEPTLTIARAVVASDPLAARMAASERVRRVLVGLTRAADRHDMCQEATGADPKAPDAMHDDLTRTRRLSRSVLQDSDELAAAVALIGAAESDVKGRCSALIEPVDEAWLLIAGLHQGGSS